MGFLAAGDHRRDGVRDVARRSSVTPPALPQRLVVRSRMDVRRDVLDGAAHRARLHRGGGDLRQRPRPRRPRVADRQLAGDRPAGCSHARRDHQVLVPVRRRPAGQHGDRPGGRSASRHLPRRGSHPPHLGRVPTRLRARRPGAEGAAAGPPPAAVGHRCAARRDRARRDRRRDHPRRGRSTRVEHGTHVHDRRRAGGRRAGDPSGRRAGTGRARTPSRSDAFDRSRYGSRSRAVAGERGRRERRAVRRKRSARRDRRRGRQARAYRSRSA